MQTQQLGVCQIVRTVVRCPQCYVLRAAVLLLPMRHTPATAETPVTLTLTVTNAGNVKVAGVDVTSTVGLACQADGAAFDLGVGASKVCRYVLASAPGDP